MDTVQTIAIRQYASQTAAQAYCRRKSKLVEEIWEGNVHMVVNQLDAEAFQVELVGVFGKEIDLTDF